MNSRAAQFVALAGVLLSCLLGGLIAGLHTPTSFVVSANWLDASFTAERSLIHFAAADCPCSRRLLDYLAARGPRGGTLEHVVYFGPKNKQTETLARLGYRVQTGATAETSGVLAAPWLVVRDEHGHVQYSGGYEHAPIWEARILSELSEGRAVASLGTTGCYNSRQVRRNSLPHQLQAWLLAPSSPER